MYSIPVFFAAAEVGHDLADSTVINRESSSPPRQQDDKLDENRSARYAYRTQGIETGFPDSFRNGYMWVNSDTGFFQCSKPDVEAA